MNISPRIPFSLLASLLILTAPLIAAPPEGERVIGRRKLHEEWRVTATANGYVRRESLIVDSIIRLSTPFEQPDSGERKIDLLTEQVKVQVDVPAQKRTAQFDSGTDTPDTTLTAFELVRPVAFHQRKLTLSFNPNGTLTEIEGTEPVIRRINEIYDRDLRGSEADLHTREYSAALSSPSYLRQVFSDLICTPGAAPLDTSSNSSLALSGLTSIELPALACIPSESWLQLIHLKVRPTITNTKTESGKTSLTRSYDFLHFDEIKTEIGPVPWSYELKIGTASTRILFDDKHF
ncbi:MAG: hypothetical protein KDA36_04435, partial [Planctomycetaceae bacterium]|nr:hypothetical protein [Planctomycetaceae bacterium]